jgi:hypothetical protein
MFGTKASGVRGDTGGGNLATTARKTKLMESEQIFDLKCVALVEQEQWSELEVTAVEQLDICKGKSPLGFFYLGVSLYKLDHVEQGIKAFQKSNELDSNNA